MNIKAQIVVACVLVAVQATAGYRRGELLWSCEFSKEDVAKYKLGGYRLDPDGNGCVIHPSGGRNGDGAAKFRSPDKRHSAMFSIVPEVSFSGVVQIEAEVRGVDLGPGLHHYNGPKVMFPHKPKEGAPTRYPQLPGEFGTFDWKTWVMVEEIPETTVGFSFCLGLENAAGEFWIDALHVYRAEEVSDEAVEAPYNAEAAKIPRGPFVGRHNPDARRGVMSGGDLSDASLKNLADWGGNVMRLQLAVNNRSVETFEDYFKAFEKKLDWAQDVMDRCAKHDIRIVLDLHGGPGCKATKHASNVVPEDYDTAAICRVWQMIATRFKDHPMTYAYDILNEPSTTPETWDRVVQDVMKAVRPIDPKTPFMMERISKYYDNVIYSPHFYSPHTLTHMGVGGARTIRWSYPGYINGIYWDKEQMRVALKGYIDFQRAHPGVKMLVGEFSCILWAKGADKYIRDAIEIFEEYGWDWCYHAYREWPPWDVEYDHDADYTLQKYKKATRDTERKQELVKGLSYNKIADPVAGTARADAGWVRLAAANSTAEAKAAADSVCTGTNDELTVQKAVDLCKRNGKHLFFFTGLYRFESVKDFGDGGPKTAVCIRNMHRAFSIVGERRSIKGWPKDMPVVTGPTFYLTPEAVSESGGESVDILRGEWSERGMMNGSALRMENLAVWAPNPKCRMRAIDLRRVASLELKNLNLQAFGSALLQGLRYPYGLEEAPLEDCIGVTLTDGSNNVPVNLANILCTGFGQGFQVGGEHVVMINCSATFGLYGFTFGNYPYHCGFNHPITLINCCDEQNVNLPLFNSCGDNGGKIHGRQEVTMISFNCERVAEHTPGKKLGDLMREVRPGTWRGNISFTRQPRWNDINSVDEPIWQEDGSGSGFVTRNNAHRPVCGTKERLSYYPQLGQQIFDTDIGKLVICIDPKTRKWVDAMGNEVR